MFLCVWQASQCFTASSVSRFIFGHYKYDRAELFILLIPGWLSWRFLRRSFGACVGTTTREPHSTQPSGKLSSVFLVKWGLISSDVFTSGQPFCTQSLTLAKTGSNPVHYRICLAVTGVVSTCSINRTVSPGSGCSSTETSRGSRLSPLALEFFFPSLNLIVYT